MKKRASFVAMYLCLLMLFTCGVGELVFVDRAARPSPTENRMLQGFPKLSFSSVFSGSFMDEFEAFLSDGFFFRDAAARFSDGVLGLFALPGDEVAIGARRCCRPRPLMRRPPHRPLRHRKPRSRSPPRGKPRMS